MQSLGPQQLLLGAASLTLHLEERMAPSMRPTEQPRPAMSDLIPYYAVDTDGVHFEVEIEGIWIQAYVSRRVLCLAYGPSESNEDCLALYLGHRADIDAAVRRRVQICGLESVLVRDHELQCRRTGSSSQS